MGSGPIVVEIDAIAHGGDGIGTLPDGKKVFVPDSAPGDRVELEGIEDRGQHARARIAAIREASPLRVSPPCPHVDRCGGCHLQHLKDEAQRAIREKGFFEILERIGGVSREGIPEARSIVASPSTLRYRIRCRLHVRKGRVGYARRGSHEIEPFEGCSLLVPPLEALAISVVRLLHDKPLAGLAEIDLCVGEDGLGAMALHPGPGAPQNFGDRADRHFQSIDGLKGIVVIPPPAPLPKGRKMPPGGNRPVPKIFGDPVVERQAPLAHGVRLLGRPDAFAQAHGEANELLVREAIEGLSVEPSDEVLELYGGAGNFTFALSERAARVTVVEEAGVSLELARKAAGEAGVDNVRFIAGDAGAVVRDWVGQGRTVDRILLDPPRAGARGLAEGLARLEPRRIAYVSCDPATLARDLAAFRDHGYVPAMAVPVDMFPQTAHVEGVVILEPV